MHGEGRLLAIQKHLQVRAFTGLESRALLL
ncbi:hypothetical protein CARN8_1540014 [mine drainage metagenome]|uniref:Uncharacterized protein n=1 Tax=mine drainage metagenome TaxID=410659 RepID=A0A3P3ZLU9_9ZZZZ